MINYDPDDLFVRQKAIPKADTSMEFTLIIDGRYTRITPVNDIAKETTINEIECDITELQNTIQGLSELQALLTRLKDL